MSFKNPGKIIIICIISTLVFFTFTSGLRAEEKVSIDFDNVDIKVFVKFISEVTKKNFVIDNRVKGKVTVLSPGKISPEDAYKVFESVLDVYGFSAVPSGEVIKIISTFEARTKNMETIEGRKTNAEEDKLITQIIPLKYADPKNIQRLISPIVSKKSAVMAYKESSMIIITDYQSNIKRLLKIIDAIDIKETGREITIINLDKADAEELSKTLKQIFPDTRRPGEKITVNNVRFIPDKRTNTLIAVAGKQDIERIKEIVDYLDKEKPKADERFHVYYLENSDAESLAKILQDLVSGQKTQSNNKNQKSAPIISGNLYIAADKATNTLIIKAGKNDYDIIESLIKKLDINRPMVYLECLIIEMNINNDLGIGAEWAIGYEEDIKNTKGAYGGGFSGNKLAPYATTGQISKGLFPSGFSLGVMTEALNIGGVVFPNLGAVFNAYKNDKNVNIISNPQLKTLDNETAKINVGKNIPYLIKSSTGDNQYNNFEYKDVGVRLEITPQINQDGYVKLKIFQGVSRLESTAGSLGELPTTLKRDIETTVVVKDGSTVVLGGLIDESFSESDNKVPCFGEIPVVGYLFKNHGNSRDKTNMYVFITPHVIKNKEDDKKLFKIKKDKIKKIIKDSMKNNTREIPLYE